MRGRRPDASALSLPVFRNAMLETARYLATLPALIPWLLENGPPWRKDAKALLSVW